MTKFCQNVKTILLRRFILINTFVLIQKYSKNQDFAKKKLKKRWFSGASQVVAILFIKLFWFCKFRMLNARFCFCKLILRVKHYTETAL